MDELPSRFLSAVYGRIVQPSLGAFAASEQELGAPLKSPPVSVLAELRDEGAACAERQSARRSSDAFRASVAADDRARQPGLRLSSFFGDGVAGLNLGERQMWRLRWLINGARIRLSQDVFAHAYLGIWDDGSCAVHAAISSGAYNGVNFGAGAGFERFSADASSLCASIEDRRSPFHTPGTRAQMRASPPAAWPMWMEIRHPAKRARTAHVSAFRPATCAR